MKINIDKNLVEFTPESSDEKVKLEALWRLVVDCVRFNKKLVRLENILHRKMSLPVLPSKGLRVMVRMFIRKYMRTRIVDVIARHAINMLN